MLTPSIDNLNEARMRRVLAESRRKFPGRDDVFLAYAMSSDVIINALGTDIRIREVVSGSTGGDGFIRADPQMRVYQLGSMLWQARSVVGFERWTRRARRRPFKAAFYELYWLVFLSEFFDEVSLKTERGLRGEDFDIVCRRGYLYPELAVEIKTRSERFETTKQIKNYINKARAQLPKGGDGAVFFLLTSLSERVSQDDLDACLASCVRSSSRLRLAGYLTEIRASRGEAGFLAFQHSWVDETGRVMAFSQQAESKVVTPTSLIRLYCGEAAASSSDPFS
jgi:hypothetical protein